MDNKKMSFIFKEFAAVRTIVLISGLFWANILLAEVTVYKETENEGMNRYERFASIEKHLIELDNTINKLEMKLSENTKMVKSLDAKFTELQTVAKKKPEDAKNEKVFDGKKFEEEMKKLKDDFLTLKNKDIESMRTDLYDLKISQRVLEGKLH